MRVGAGDFTYHCICSFGSIVFTTFSFNPEVMFECVEFSVHCSFGFSFVSG